MTAFQPHIEETEKHYSVAWARIVVQDWMEKRPRGAKMLCDYFGIDEEIMVGLLKKGRPEWHILTQMASYFEEYVQKRDGNPWSSAYRMEDMPLVHCIIQKPYVKSSESLYNYLTARFFE